MKDLFPGASDKRMYTCRISLTSAAWAVLSAEAKKRGVPGESLISALLEAWAYKPATSPTRPRYTAPLREADRVLYRDDEPLIDARDDEG